MPATRPFTTGLTDAVLQVACESSGLNAAGASLLRFGENAIYRLPSVQVVVRIGRSLVAAEKEVNVARWLQDNRFPAAQLAPDLEEPVVIDGVPVTFWEYIEEDNAPITSAEFGTVLHDLHRLPNPTNFDLPPFSPMPKVEQRLRDIPQGYLDPSDIDFLRTRLKELSAEFERLSFVLPLGPIHCDAHPGNLMHTRRGEIKLIDFEDFAYGPREWDAAILSVRHQAFGWTSDEEYKSYVRAYGFDPTTWAGFPVIRAIRELNMTTWLAQTIGQSAEVKAEVVKRIADLRNDQAPRDWRAF
jgi:hypothetical protein